MKTNDIFENYEASEDNYSYINIDHKRRPRVTLKHLHKLRKARTIEINDREQRVQDASLIYGRKEEESEF